MVDPETEPQQLSASERLLLDSFLAVLKAKDKPQEKVAIRRFNATCKFLDRATGAIRAASELKKLTTVE